MQALRWRCLHGVCRRVQWNTLRLHPRMGRALRQPQQPTHAMPNVSSCSVQAQELYQTIGQQ